MSDSDEPNNTIIEQLQALTARLERLMLTQPEKDSKTNQRLGALERHFTELERSGSQRVTAATSPQLVSPPRAAVRRRIQGRTVTSSRSRRRDRPTTETFAIGDEVHLLDQKKESTPHGSVVGFTRVGWTKIILENGVPTIRKTNNITKNFKRSP